MEAPESYAVSERDVESYQNDGAVLLKNVFDLKWIEHGDVTFLSTQESVRINRF